MIAPQFAYHDITTIRLLGTSLWHTPRLLSTAGRYTQKSVIPTPFFAGSPDPEAQRLVEAYRQAEADEAAEPSAYTAYGYDAGRLLLTMMDREHVSNREGLVESLKHMGPFPGVTGRFTFDDNGDYQSEPILVTVEGNRVPAYSVTDE